MKLILVAFGLAVLVQARPNIPLPSGSYLPQFGLSSNGGYNYNQGSFLKGATSGLGGLSGGNFIGGGNIGGGFIGGHGIGGATGPLQDQKYAFFYSAPDELEQSRLRIYVTPNSARNTKVIFIKAPSYGSVRPEVIAPPSITEDKTLVYVLVKKPENGGSITIPATFTSRRTKPEVFFINYKTQQEAEQVIANGLQEQAIGPNVPELGNAQTFVSTLQSGIPSDIGGGVIGGDISGSNLLGGISGGHIGGIIGGNGKYGPPGASGPYRR